MKLKSMLSCIMASALMLSLASCGSSTDTGTSTGGVSSSKDANTLMVGQGADAKSLDPQASNDSVSSTVCKQIYDTLFYQDENMELQPSLVDTYELLEEGTLLHMTLKEGIYFHNGEELKASDVKFTLERALDSAEVIAIVGPIETVEVLGDYELEVHLSYSFAPILSHLAHTAISILNEKAVTESGADYGTTVVVGTGAYAFDSWQIGDRINLVRNEDYWNGVAKTEKITYRSIPDSSARLIELESGGIDICYDISPTDVERVETSESMKLINSNNFSNSYVGFNVEKAPFDNVLVRQAINWALDIDAIVEVVYNGTGQTATGPIGEMVWAYSEDLTGYGYDVEKAKELLAEAGYPDGFETTIWTNENTQRTLIAEIVQNQLAAVGITVKMETLEWGTYLDDTAAGKHDMFIFGWVTVTGDPDYGLYASFHSDNIGSSGNRAYYANDRVDELLDLARSSTSQEERAEAYAEVQQIIVDDAPWIFTWEGAYLTATGSYVDGFVHNPAGHHVLKNVTIS